MKFVKRLLARIRRVRPEYPKKEIWRLLYTIIHQLLDQCQYQIL